MTDTLASRDLVVGVDVGGSKVEVLVVDGAGSPIGRFRLAKPIGDQDGAVEVIEQAIGTALADATVPLAAVAGVGVGVPGRVDRLSGTVSLAVNLGWQEFPLGPRLSERLGTSVALENDVRAAAFGLHRRRVLGDVDDLAYLSIGTGISAGVIIDGSLHRGTRGLAGEIGHIVLDPDGPPCPCGLHGCFETLAAGPAIARAAIAGLAAGRESSLAARDGNLTAADVYEAASVGDALARDITERVGRHVARAVHELVMAYDVEVVVLGGGVAGAGDTFLDPILRALDAMRDASPLAREVLRPGVVHLLPAGSDTGAWGAVALAQSAIEAGVPDALASADGIAEGSRPHPDIRS
jgi:glucokinase